MLKINKNKNDEIQSFYYSLKVILLIINPKNKKNNKIIF